MNQPQTPSLNNAVEGFVFAKPDESNSINIDYKVLEISCINLISKLENCLAKARELPKDEFIDESGEIGGRMLETLNSFCNEFMTGATAQQVREEIERTQLIVDTYGEVLKTRPLSNALIRTFWTIDESDDIQASHKKLGEGLVRACAVAFYHAVILVGLDTEFGLEIDQSTVVFVNELKQSWN